MKKRTKIILIAVAGVVLAAILAFAGYWIWLMQCFSSRTIDDIQAYAAACETDPALPALPADDVLGDYEKVDFLFHESLAPISSCRWYRIDLAYTAAEYTAQKEHLNRAYVFAEEASDQTTGGYEPTFTYRDYIFHTEAELWFPKEMFFVGFNETAHKICLILFTDYELDGASDFPVFFEERGFLD